MKLLVAIPSKARSSTIFRDTLRWVPRLGYDVRVFVEPQEIEEYREAATLANHDNRTAINDQHFVDIKENNKGLGYAKEFIKQYATENGYDLVFKMDDDVRRWRWRGRNKPDDLMVIDFATMVGKCRVTFGKYPDVAAIGFPYGQELYPDSNKEWSAINARLQSCYIIRTEYLIGGYASFEDFAQYIYIRTLNKNTLRYGLAGMDNNDTGKQAGGMQLFDREQLVEVEMQGLRSMYPALQFKPVKGKRWTIEPVMTGAFFGVKNL